MHACVCMYVCMFMYIYICIYMYIYVYMYICIYICLYIYMSIYVYIYIHVYTPLYTHALIGQKIHVYISILSYPTSQLFQSSRCTALCAKNFCHFSSPSSEPEASTRQSWWRTWVWKLGHTTKMAILSAIKTRKHINHILMRQSCLLWMALGNVLSCEYFNLLP